MAEYMLSTSDNPFNPFEQWDEWFVWDQAAGYNSLDYLARVVRTSNELSDVDRKLSIELGIDEIVRENITGTYIKVVWPSEEKT